MDALRRKKPPADNLAVSRENTISRCRYIRCRSCGAVYAKDAVLSDWQAFLMLGKADIVFGTRTCKCGTVMQVQDIYIGVHDLPKQYWGEVPGPAEVD